MEHKSVSLDLRSLFKLDTYWKLCQSSKHLPVLLFWICSEKPTIKICYFTFAWHCIPFFKFIKYVNLCTSPTFISDRALWGNSWQIIEKSVPTMLIARKNMSVSDGKKQKNQGIKNKLPEQHNNNNHICRHLYLHSTRVWNRSLSWSLNKL